jgi:hypothetical protein
MSLYALSLLTKRQLVIDIDNPCNFDQVYVPNTVNWHPKQINKIKKVQSVHFDCMNLPTCLKRFNILDRSGDIMRNDLITINYNYDWLDYLASSSNLKKMLQSQGYKQFKLVYLFRQWYDELFKFSPLFQQKYDSFLNEISPRMTSQTQIYCAQIRMGGNLKNATKDKVINDLSSTKLFWSFLRKNFIQRNNNSDWRLFITSDLESVENEALSEFGQDRVIRFKGVNSHIDKDRTSLSLSQRQGQNDNDCSRIEKPMLDFHFLRNCHKAVVSTSGFGILGMWSRVEPVRDAYVFYRGLFKPLTHNTLPFG